MIHQEPLDLPVAQNVTKLPNIPWEVYASSIGPLENLSAHPNTRATATQVEKGTYHDMLHCLSLTLESFSFYLL